MLNEHNSTKIDPKNDEARKHIGHNVETIGKVNRVSHPIPYRFIMKQRYMCHDCGELFEVSNYIDDDRKKVEPTEVEDE